MNIFAAKPKGLYILNADTLDTIYGPDEKRRLDEMVDFFAPPQTRQSIEENPALLASVEIILTGWGAPVMDEEFLAAAPKLRAVFYGAGSVRPFVTEALWRRGITLTSAYAANAVPVAEYTLSVVLLSLKHFWRSAARSHRLEAWGDHTRAVPGNFRSTVGFVSCGVIARKTLEMLSMFDHARLVYCPFLSESEAKELDVERCSLDEIFERSDVVTLHTPLLPTTRGQIEGKHFERMKPGATFINTARGGVVRESEMLDVLSRRPDLTAVLDVCDPEPPPADSRLFQLPNVVLTPHIAGSLGPECRRLGSSMADEVARFLAGRALNWQIGEAAAAAMA